MNEIDMNIYDMENDNDKEWIELTKLFEDWTMQLLDRILYILSSKIENESILSEDSGILTIPGLLKTLFMGMGEQIYNISFEKVFKFATTNCYPNAKDQVNFLVHFACFPHPEKSVHLFVDYCNKKLVGQNGVPVKMSKDECIWYLNIANGATKMMGKALVPLKEELISIAVAGFSNDDYDCIHECGVFLRDVLIALGHVYPLESKPFNEDDMERTDFAKKHYNYWGKTYNTKTAKMHWHIPTEEELEVAGEIFNLFTTTTMTQIRDIISGKYDDLPSPVASSSPTGSPSPSPTLSPLKKEPLPSLPAISIGKSAIVGTKIPFGSSVTYKTPKRFQVVRKTPEVNAKNETEAPQKKVPKIDKSMQHKASMSRLSVHNMKTGPAKMSLKSIIVNALYRLSYTLIGAEVFFTNEFMTKEGYMKELSAAAASGDWRRQWVQTPPFPDVSNLFKCPKSITITREEIFDFAHDTFLKITDEKTSPYVDNPKILTALIKLLVSFASSLKIDSFVLMDVVGKMNKDIAYNGKSPLEAGKETHLRVGIVEKTLKVYHHVLKVARNNSPFTPIQDNLIKDLLFLSFNQFPEVRTFSQNILNDFFKRFSYQSRNYFDMLFDILADEKAPEYKIIGVADVVSDLNIAHKIISHPQYLCKYLQVSLSSMSVQLEKVRILLFNIFRGCTEEFWELSLVPQRCISIDKTKEITSRLIGDEVMPKISEETIKLVNAKKDEESRNKIQILDRTVELLSETYTKVTIPKIYLLIVPRSLMIIASIRGYTPSKTMVDVALKCSTSELPDVNSTGWRLLFHIMFLLKNIIKEKKESELCCIEGEHPQFRYMTKEELDIDYYALPVPSSEKEWNSTIFADKCILHIDL